MSEIRKTAHPRPDFMRKDWLNLNGDWNFRLFKQGDEQAESGFDRASYTDKINVPFSWASPLSGVCRDEPGTGWYMKEVEYDFDARLFLIIGACDYYTSVYVNGKLVAEHEGGYTPIEAEVTQHFKKGLNRIEVRARDDRKDSQMYGKQGYGNISGIWQTVYLEKRAANFIKSFRVTTRVNGDVVICAETSGADSDELTARFAGIEASTPVKAGKAELRFHIDSARLWSPDDPYLYEGELSLKSGDRVSTYFGVREISTGKFDGRDYNWITLNGEPIYINATLDQAFNPKGYFTYPSDDDCMAEAFKLKRLGLNAARIHIKCEEPYKLYCMDKLGVLIIADVPNFWGEPTQSARNAYESAWREYFTRDINHPCIFMWVMFNETWGLFTKTGGGKREYTTETQAWVKSVYERAKAFDPTRLVEDNSACNYDHVATDVNTWHFYIHGYNNVKTHVNGVVEKTFKGSTFNFINGNKQTDAPLMNSECGMVWGVDGSAGDSDIAWQYHYMLNEFRLRDKLCGFVFTEFHDVVNEFNGYYRIDGSEKDFGYGAFARGMTLRDMHSKVFLATDFPPCVTLAAGAIAKVPLYLSNWAGAGAGGAKLIKWELWHEGADGRITDSMGETALPECGWGVSELKPLAVEMPAENALAVLSLYVADAFGTVISRNFTTFDVRDALPENALEISLDDVKAEGFSTLRYAQSGGKLNMGGAGEASFRVKLDNAQNAGRIRVLFEAGAKRVLSKDMGSTERKESDQNFMLGYRVDRGAFENSYWMTDETRCPSELEISIDGIPVRRLTLENDPADARGALSWLYQREARKLDDAGSYGQRVEFDVPVGMIPDVVKNGGFEVSLKASDGLALYGRDSGRYPFGITVMVDKYK